MNGKTTNVLIFQRSELPILLDFDINMILKLLLTFYHIDDYPTTLAFYNISRFY